MLAGYRHRGGQAEPSPIDLRREEGVEDALEILRRDAGPMVPERYNDEIAMRQGKPVLATIHVIICGNLHPPPIGHGINGVLDNIVDHLTHLPSVDLYVEKVIIEFEIGLDIGA